MYVCEIEREMLKTKVSTVAVRVCSVDVRERDRDVEDEIK